MNTEAVRVWDLPVRLFHWLIVVLLAVSWWSAEQGGVMLKYHMWSGFTVLTLVLFRVAWGFVGSRYARFTDFVHGPRQVFGTLGALFDRRPLAIAGHNPLGGWMVVALLVCLLVQTMTGLFANDDLFNEGPLYSQRDGGARRHPCTGRRLASSAQGRAVGVGDDHRSQDLAAGRGGARRAGRGMASNGADRGQCCYRGRVDQSLTQGNER